MSALYAWLRRHPRLVDGALAAVLAFGGLASAVTMGRDRLIPGILALTAPVVFRRTHPVGAFAAAAAVGALQLALSVPIGLPDLAILVLLYTVAAYTSRRASVTALVACLLGAAAELTELHPHLERVSLPSWLLVGTVAFAGPTLIAWVLGDSMRYRRAYYAGLEERAARLEHDRDAQARIAAAAERARIARELHDVVAHNVSVMVVQADGAAYALGTDPVRARDALAAISATGRQALSEMRALLGVLRRDDEVPPAAAADQAVSGQVMPGLVQPGQVVPGEPGGVGAAAQVPAGAAGTASPRAVVGTASPRAAVGTASPRAAPDPPAAVSVPAGRPGGTAGTPGTPELAPMPGIGQLGDLLDQARAAGLPVSWAVDGEERPLQDGTALAVYRIIQESLTNTRKHAGPGARASVLLRYRPDGVEVTVSDDGIGAAAASDGAGHGLAGMRERAAMYGGSVTAGPRPGAGFQVTAVLPAAAIRAGTP